MATHTPADEICASTEFSFHVSLGNIAANLYIIPEDENKLVPWGAPFTITFKYNEGRPAVTSSPFTVSVNVASPDALALPTIQLVTPASPQITGDAEAEKTGVVALMAPPRPDGSPSQDDMNLLDYIIDISMYQPDYGEISSGTTYHSDANANVPNVRSSEDGENILIAWDVPTDQNGQFIEVDVAVSVSTDTETAEERRTSILESFESSRMITLALDYIDELLVDDLEEGETAEITVTLTPARERRPQGGTQPVTATFYWPPRTRPPIPPTNLDAVSNAAGAALLTWREARSLGNFIADYEYGYKLSSSAFWSNYSSTGGRTLTTTISGLTPNELYDFRVRAKDGIGRYSAADEVNNILIRS